MSENNETAYHRIVSIPHGSVFRTYEKDIMIKLFNPEIPPLANLMDYKVWGADIGNGRIIEFSPYEDVVLLYGSVFDWVKGRCDE